MIADAARAGTVALPGPDVIRAEMLRGRRGRVETALWSRWMDQAAALADRWWVEHRDDPFGYNETASVSHLCSGAALGGLLGLAEYVTIKKRSEDRRFAGGGRCDLWLSDRRRSWAFEFKQLAELPYRPRLLEQAMGAAVACARCVREREADGRVAALVASMRWHGSAELETARPIMAAFASRCDYAWRIGTERLDDPETYVYFVLVG